MEGRRPGRVWVIPPAIARGPGETIDRVGVLAEHDDAGGVLLWRLVRDVELWAGTPVANRSELFSPGAREARTARLRESTVPTDVRVLLRALNRILSGSPDAPGIEEDAATACAGVAQWAREIEARETAVAFAQAAALCSDSARYGLLTGTCAREARQGARAMSWFSRAVALARRERDWRSYAVAFLALGEEAEAAGDLVLARRRYVRAFRTTRRFRNLVGERARAAYAVFRLSRDAGDAEAACTYARAATPAVMKSQPGAAALALRLASYWIEQGTPEHAVRILQYLAKLDALPREARLPAAILRVRAETATGNLLAARRAWADAWSLVGEASAGPALADPLLELVECAAALCEPGGVEAAGRAALTHASPEDYARIRTAVRALALQAGEGSAEKDAA
jgi:tetratricopeptide (TPR) repeat protein